MDQGNEDQRRRVERVVEGLEDLLDDNGLVKEFKNALMRSMLAVELFVMPDEYRVKQ